MSKAYIKEIKDLKIKKMFYFCAFMQLSFTELGQYMSIISVIEKELLGETRKHDISKDLESMIFRTQMYFKI